MFKSHLTYCLTLWGSTCPAYIEPINILHNKFLKQVLLLPQRTNTSILYRQSSTLTLSNLYRFHVALLIFKSIHYPSTFPKTRLSLFSPLQFCHNHNTRGSNTLNIFSKSSLITSRYNSIAIQGPLVWNALPANIKSLQTVNQFKAALRLCHFNSFY
jgi:hypothetical protein